MPPREQGAGTISSRAPLVLIVSEHEWSARSLATVLSPEGYAVLRAYNAAQGVERATLADPDIVFVDHAVAGNPGIELVRALSEQEAISPATPVILMTEGPVARERRLEALRAGAWDVLSLPTDAEELRLRVEKQIRAKREADRARDEALVDAATGFYSREGVTRRLQELSAAADRFGRPLACVVFTLETDATAAAPLLTRLADVLRGATRKSDILGRIGPADFLVVTPETPPDGAEHLAERLRQRAVAVDETTPARVHVHGLDDLRESDDPHELLSRLTGMGPGSSSEMN